MSMTREEASHILNPDTTREALAPYAYDPEQRIKIVEEACRVAVAALRPVSREQVKKVWRGEWLHDPETGYEHCDKCSHTISLDDYLNRKPPLFCEMCGDAQTDEAVEMVMERLEALKDGSTTD